MGKVDLLQTLCDEEGISINALEKELGFSRGSLAKIDSSKPSAEKIYILSRRFDIPMECWFGDDVDIKKIRQYENARMHYDSAISTMSDKELLNIVSTDPISGQPVYDISAGKGRLNEGYPTEWMDTTEDSDEYSWCTIHGDSMYPRLYDGDLIRVHHQTETSPRDLTVVKIDGDAVTVKYVEITNDGVWLRAENKDVFEDKFYSVQQVLTLPIQIVGKVVEMRRAL